MDRLCENINAEIASGTVTSIFEAAGYLTWTFFARRVKSNPSYYGLESLADDGLEDFLLSIAQEALRKLKENGCIDFKGDNQNACVAITSLGFAASNYYLLYETPKQMQFAVREARKIIMKEVLEAKRLGNSKKNVELSDTNCLLSTTVFVRSPKLDEISTAWLLYSLSSTREIDELPVRHNEEYLNKELSSTLAWGPDASSVLSDKKDRYINEDIFGDPHTKCFLLLQAYIERAKLPISDYVNDTKSIIENFPRLLAAMEYIAANDASTAGSFELLTQFPRARQLFHTRSTVRDDPFIQFHALTPEMVRIIQNGLKGQNLTINTILDLRNQSRSVTIGLLQGLSKGLNTPKIPVENVVGQLYAIPAVNVSEIIVRQMAEKTTGKTIGKLQCTLEFEREKSRSPSDDSTFTLNLILGTAIQGILLATSTVRVTRYGKWRISKEISFDWSAANADGGEDAGEMILRILFDEARGFDQELRIRLR